MKDAALLVIGITLVAGAGEYYKPLSTLSGAAHIALTPGHFVMAGIAGLICLCYHQRQSDPVKE